ncbi:MAG: elongation factor G [Thermoanaerobaculia bacterium]|nr:elongation factor G [Thermoanaerobaculia bacterium]
MQVDSPDKIRNLTLAGHADTGKTTLASASLYSSDVENRLGKVEDGHATTDYDEQEIERGYSIGLGPCFVPWKKHKINVVDTPGSGIFGVEARAGARATDCMVLVVNASSGIEVTTERLWRYSEEIEQPVVLHINKLDRENTEFSEVVGKLTAGFDVSMVPIQVPIGSGADFRGVVDLVHEKAYEFDHDGDGKGKQVDIPADLADAVETARTELIEAVAETSEELMEAFFEEGTLNEIQLIAGLRRAILGRQIFVVTAGSALHGIGTSTWLDAVVDLLPSPIDRDIFPATTIGGDDAEVKVGDDEPFSALVFKTLNDPFSGKINLFRVVSGTLSSDSQVWNSREEQGEKIGQLLHLQGKKSSPTPQLITGDIGGVAKLKHTRSGDTLCVQDRPVRLGWIEIRPPAISYAVEPKSKGDEEKISDALHRMMEEDLGLAAGRDEETHEFLLSGSGDLHVDIAIARLKSRFKVEVIKHPPKVPYRETVRRAAEGHGRHKKQTGGRGQFADCKITIEPLRDGSEFEFVDEIFGGAIPQGFRPAVEKGIQEARRRGYLSGHPVVGFRVRLQDGQYHDVDSSEMAFKVAGSLAFKDAMAKAGATLLEPVMSVEITTPEEFMGDIMGDLSQHRGKPQGMETLGDNQVIKATVPMAEMLDYAPRLRSITQGRARFTMDMHGYEEVPKNLQLKIIEAAKKEEEEEH